MAKSTASPVVSIGRILYALAIIAFGLQYAIFGHLRLGLPLCPNWLPNGSIIAYALAAIFIAAGLALVATWRVATVSLILGILLLASRLHLGQQFRRRREMRRLGRHRASLRLSVAGTMHRRAYQARGG